MSDSNPADAPLTLDGVTLTLPSAAGPVEILRGVDFSVSPGERVAVVGPSGCGKSSLIAVAAGLERPTSGRGAAAGRGPGPARRGRPGAAAARTGVAGLPVLPPAAQHDRARRTSPTPLEIAGARGAAETARDWLGRVGLAGRLDHYPHQLSGGEQQRVALARALAASPAAAVRRRAHRQPRRRPTPRRVADLMFDLVAQTGAALVLVTHDDALAARADRKARMADGRMVDGGRML